MIMTSTTTLGLGSRASSVLAARAPLTSERSSLALRKPVPEDAEPFSSRCLSTVASLTTNFVAANLSPKTNSRTTAPAAECSHPSSGCSGRGHGHNTLLYQQFNPGEVASPGVFPLLNSGPRTNGDTRVRHYRSTQTELTPGSRSPRSIVKPLMINGGQAAAPLNSMQVLRALYCILFGEPSCVGSPFAILVAFTRPNQEVR